MRSEKRLYCLEHESLNQPCDEYLLEVEVEGFAGPCRMVSVELRYLIGTGDPE